jgi:predicted secreted protein
MAITSAIVLFSVIWFMLLLIALPMRMRSQEQDGHIVPGTPASAPVDPMIGKKMIWVTVATFVLWVPLVAFIMSGIVSIHDIDFYNRMGPSNG